MTLDGPAGARRNPQAQCGTRSGYNRHRRLGEAACELCLGASAADSRGRYRRVDGAPSQPRPKAPTLEIRYPTPETPKRPDLRKPREHGTMRGYRQHRNEGERPCDPCRLAQNTYQRERRARN